MTTPSEGTLPDEVTAAIGDFPEGSLTVLIQTLEHLNKVLSGDDPDPDLMISCSIGPQLNRFVASGLISETDLLVVLQHLGFPASTENNQWSFDVSAFDRISTRDRLEQLEEHLEIANMPL